MKLGVGKIHASYPGIFVTLITAAAAVNTEHVKNGKKSDPNPHVPIVPYLCNCVQCIGINAFSVRSALKYYQKFFAKNEEKPC